MAAEAAAEPVERIVVLLAAGGEDALGVGAGVGAVAAPYFAVDHRRAKRLFGGPVGGVDGLIDLMEEREQLILMPIQVSRELVVAGMGFARRDAFQKPAAQRLAIV